MSESETGTERPRELPPADGALRHDQETDSYQQYDGVYGRWGVIHPEVYQDEIDQRSRQPGSADVASRPRDGAISFDESTNTYRKYDAASGGAKLATEKEYKAWVTARRTESGVYVAPEGTAASKSRGGLTRRVVELLHRKGR